MQRCKKLSPLSRKIVNLFKEDFLMGNYGTAVDKKWQEKWEKEELYKFNPENLDKKLYKLKNP